jgi:hypothetical protein
MTRGGTGRGINRQDAEAAKKKMGLAKEGSLCENPSSSA